MRNLTIDRKEKIKTLRRNDYFRTLDEATLAQISQHMHLREFERGEILFWEGEPCAGLHIIQHGSVKLFRLSPQGRQYIVRVLQEGDTCNEVPTFDCGNNPVNLEALEACRVWVIETEILRALAQENPEFSRRIIANLTANLRNLVQMVSEMAFFHVTHRLARLISDLSAEELSGSGSARWTQDQMAAHLGTVREVVARSLKELERSGAIRVNRRCIQIADQALLDQWAHPWMETPTDG